MKRITQILASVLFVISVLTVYLAFDFAINNAVAHKNPSHKRSLHDHDHQQEGPKFTRKRSMTPSTIHHTRRSNQTIKHHDDIDDQNLNNEHQLRQDKQHKKAPLRAKPGNFHKGKTGVKVNKPHKVIKEHRKRLSGSTTTTTTIQLQQNNKHHLNDNKHI